MRFHPSEITAFSLGIVLLAFHKLTPGGVTAEHCIIVCFIFIPCYRLLDILRDRFDKWRKKKGTAES